jgi:hypothetical protein
LINDDSARTQTKSDDITTTLTSVACIHSLLMCPFIAVVRQQLCLT